MRLTHTVAQFDSRIVQEETDTHFISSRNTTLRKNIDSIYVCAWACMCVHTCCINVHTFVNTCMLHICVYVHACTCIIYYVFIQGFIYIGSPLCQNLTLLLFQYLRTTVTYIHQHSKLNFPPNHFLNEALHNQIYEYIEMNKRVYTQSMDLTTSASVLLEVWYTHSNSRRSPYMEDNCQWILYILLYMYHINVHIIIQ